MSDSLSHRHEDGKPKTLKEFFAPIGEQLISEAEREKRQNQAVTAALQDVDPAGAEEATEVDKFTAVRQLREQGDAEAAASLDRDITHEERHGAFSSFVAKGYDEVKDQPRDITGGIAGGVGYPKTKR